MANPFEEYDRKYGTLSVSAKKMEPADRRRLNTPAPKAEVKEQCKLCQVGGRLHCKGRDRNCGCRWCTGDGRE